jgi:hypothetical protein
MLADSIGQRRSELLDPAQDRSAAHVDASIDEDAGDALGRGTQLQVVADGEQDDVTREAMACYKTGRLGRGMAATASAGVDDPTTLIAAIASQVGRGAARARRHRADPTRSANPRPMSQNRSTSGLVSSRLPNRVLKTMVLRSLTPSGLGVGNGYSLALFAHACRAGRALDCGFAWLAILGDEPLGRGCMPNWKRELDGFRTELVTGADGLLRSRRVEELSPTVAWRAWSRQGGFPAQSSAPVGSVCPRNAGSRRRLTDG